MLCPFCGGEAAITCFEKLGSISGDLGYLVVIECIDIHHICGAKISKWALKKSWAIESAIKAWKRGIEMDYSHMYCDSCRGVIGEHNRKTFTCEKCGKEF